MSINARPVGPSRNRFQIEVLWTEDGSRRQVASETVDLGNQTRRTQFAQQICNAVPRTLADVEQVLISIRDNREAETPQAPKDPFRLAGVCLHPWEDNSQRLVYWRQEFYQYQHGRYENFSKDDLKARFRTSIRRNFEQLASEGVVARDGFPHVVSERLLHNVIGATQSLCKIPDSQEAPAWLDGRGDRPEASSVLPVSNGLLDLSATPAQLLNSTTEFFSLHGVDYDYDENAECPQWLNFLSQLFEDDPESIALLQQWFGYVLSTDTSYQKFLLMVGPTRSGKGTISRILSKVVGDNNVAGPTLKTLQSNFGLQTLLGKPLAIVGDARLSHKVDVASLLGIILSITGEDKVPVDRKNLTMLNVKLPTRIVICTNEFPRFRDSSDALFSRLLLLELRQSFVGREDRSLDARLAEELPGILIWGIQGLQRLRTVGSFTSPNSSREPIENARRLLSPVIAFADDCLEFGQDMETLKDSLYQAWLSYRDSNGIYSLREKEAFYRSFHGAFPTLSESQPTAPDGGRRRVLRGVRLRATGQASNQINGAGRPNFATPDGRSR